MRSAPTDDCRLPDRRNGVGLGLGHSSVIDALSAAAATLVVRYRNRPHPLVAQAWLWLAAQTDNLEEKRRCLNAVLQLDPEDETTS